MKKIKLNFTEELSNKYWNLTSREIPLVDLGISSRVFFYWKEKGLIRYIADGDSDKRTKVRLNYFEAFWLMIIKELRIFGISDLNVRTIYEVLNYTTKDQYDAGNYTEEHFLESYKIFEKDSENNEEISESLNDFIDAMGKIPDEERILITQFGGILSLLLFSNENPKLILMPNENPENNDEIPFFVGVITDAEPPTSDLFILYMNPSISKLTIPLRPIFEKLFESEIKTESFLHYRLITDREKQILDIIESKNFKELKIKMNGETPTVTIIQNGEFTGDKAKEIRRILGVKNYKNITLKFRNDKHIYYENEI